MKLILLGPPGAGKGTQAEKIAEEYSLAHISTGDMLRAEIALKTPLGIKAKELMDYGNLVPDDIINSMVASRIKQDDCVNGFLLDGYPRNIAQAEALRAHVDIDAVLDIDVDPEILILRIASRRVCPKCNHAQSVAPGEAEICARCASPLMHRDDDNPESIRHRLEVYYRQTYPLIEYYRAAGLLIPIDGSKSIDQVGQEISDRLKAL